MSEFTFLYRGRDTNPSLSKRRRPLGEFELQLGQGQVARGHFLAPNCFSTE